MRILFTAAPGYGLMLPIVPLIWAARAAGHEVLLATTAEMTEAGARAGLPVVDVFPDRDVWRELLAGVGSLGERPDVEQVAAADGLSEEYRKAARTGNPFGLFTTTMTEGTIAAGRAFGADLVVFTSDHAAGRLAAVALGAPALEVGNRVSWSTRDAETRERRDVYGDDEIVRALRAKLGIPAGQPDLIARVDPRAPSMGGLAAGQTDSLDGVPWWSMRYVPFNGGSVVPDWALRAPERPRVCVTLGTVVPVITGTSNLSVVIEALGGMDVEVVLAAGDTDLADLGELPGNVRSVDFLPLSSFLPTCSLIVHHGGSGTTAAALHYGVPQLVLPAFADNPMSARRVVDRGVGLSHDPATVDVAGVRNAVRRLLAEPAFRAAAREVSAEMATQPSPASVIERAVAAALQGVA
ncbi:glycosyl transferase [Saccharopolyspora subtropica]|uniref:Glycosyl transferase n=1 Tax=Saccharopolyspora thermophila TaxID=89367 RepID=A0A917JL91_9PSEU|nr:nucleotide disphospho-sugar-binding domain-containing protein [Saccharopolyspora subtropica]GGI73017.1 glycosyl transferase [Saccharopolyspora subtropica]